MPASIATVLVGYILLTTRIKALNQVVGYLVLENGIFIFGMLLIEAMPLVVEIPPGEGNVLVKRALARLRRWSK